MFLRRLVEYSRRLPRDPVLYASAPMRYHISLDGQGLCLGLVDTADPSSPQTKWGKRQMVPRVKRTSGIKPLLLSDTGEYTFGIPGKDAKPERVRECWQAYLAQVKRCAEVTCEPAVEAVYRFLTNDPLAHVHLPTDYDPAANVTFVVDGHFVVELPAVQEFWAAENAPGDTVMQCVICGRQLPVLRRLQTPIKGVPGGQPSGTAIISANSDAFESYGLQESLIAPTCAACGESFTRGLNDLLSKRENSIVTGGAALVFWTKEEHTFSLRDWFDTPNPEQVQALIESFRTGKGAPAVDATAFYAAILSGSGGRTVVRDWIDTTVAEVKEHLVGWFAGQSVVGAGGEPPKPLGIFALAAGTVRDAGKDLAPTTPRALRRAALTGTPALGKAQHQVPPIHALWRAALTGTPVPASLLWQAVQRNCAEGKVTVQRAALIKLVLCSGEHDRARRRTMEDKMTQLDLDNPNPAYRCGRLLAVLEEVQKAALPGINQTIVDRFYGTASSAPASVFGRLLRGAQPHLAKLKRDRPAVYRAVQTRLEDIQAGLSGFPRTLTLEEQGVFALGYYHQRAYDRAQAREMAARKKNGAPADELENTTMEEE